MAAVVNAVHACDAALGCDAWFEWVPSKANVSDLPSREASTWDSNDAAFYMASRTWRGSGAAARALGVRVARAGAALGGRA